MTEMAENNEPVTKRNWLVPLIVLVGVVALTIVALNREPVTLDPDTPEGTVQAYLQSISDQDYEAALTYMTEDIQQRCDPEDIADNVYTDSFSATLGDVEDVGSIIVVEVSINQSDSGFSSGYFERIEVAEEDGEYAVSGEPWPYFTYSCDNQ
jgi:hypothetical protein